MTGRSITPIVVDTDNALGPPRRFREKLFGGDVDDAFALACLLLSGHPVAQIWSVGGNTTAARAHLNNLSLLNQLGMTVVCREGLDPGSAVALEACPPSSSEYLALGPLTNLAAFLGSGVHPSRVTMTLGRIHTLGAWPPLWPMEFNATQDINALRSVLGAPCPKRIVPLDVAKQLRISPVEWAALRRTSVGGYLQRNSRRWCGRSLLVRGSARFPVWDLVSVMALICPETCEFREGRGHLLANGLFLCDIEGRAGTHHDRARSHWSGDIEIVSAIDAPAMWRRFTSTLMPG